MTSEVPTTASSLRRPLALFALVCTAFAYAYLAQGTGMNQGSHYALVKALAQGTPRIDLTRGDIGDLGTTDVAVRGGHVYSSKAPGLAFLALPAYLAFRGAGGRTHGDPSEALWALTLWAVVVPALVLLTLIAVVAERLEPGLGLATAVIVALGTLLLPYGTLFYAHVLSAALGFAGFTLLFFARSFPQRRRLALAAGIAAGLAVTTEYPLALVAALLAAYLLADGNRAARLASYLGGVCIGIAPLLAFNSWAFGRPWALSYAYADVGRHTGLFGVGLTAPKPMVAMRLLFAPTGLLRLSPILAAALVGLVLLYRRGYRAEALLAAATFVLCLTYNSGYFVPFGGASAGPRFLIVTLPFLALGISSVLRAAAAPTCALAIASVAAMTCVTATHPQSAADGRVLHRLLHGGFSQSFIDLRYVLGWPGVIPFFAAVAGGLAAALVSLRPLFARRPSLGAAPDYAATGMARLSDRRSTFLSFQPPAVGEEEVEAVAAVIRSGWLSSGPRTAELERLAAETLGVDHVVAVSSCTAALQLSLEALRVGAGDEVITSSITWPATANAIVHAGARPVFADVREDDLTMDPEQVGRMITERTKAIVPVHLAGQPCELDQLRSLGVPVIEDAAHAFEARYRGRVYGESEAACFSLYATKGVAAGEGGLVATNRSELAAAVDGLRMMRRGEDALYDLEAPAYKANLPDVLAAIALVQLEKAGGHRASRARQFAAYDAVVAELDGITPLIRDPRDAHAHHLYIVRIDPERAGGTRDDYRRALAEENIGTSIHFLPVHRLTAYRRLLPDQPRLPTSERAGAEVLSLPLSAAHSDDDIADAGAALARVHVAFTGSRRFDSAS